MYYEISHYRSRNQRIYVFLNNVSSRAKIKSSIQQKCCRRLYHYVYFLTSQYLPRDWQSTLTPVNNKTDSFYIKFLFYFNSESMYLKHIRSIQYGRKFKPSISNDIWPHILISEVGLYFPWFWLLTWLIYFYSHLWQFFTYSKDRKALEYTVSWSPIGLSQIQLYYYLSTVKEPKYKYYLEKYFLIV